MEYKETFESLDDAILSGCEDVCILDSIGIMDLDKPMENTIWRQMSLDYCGDEVTFNFAKDEEENLAHFNRGEKITLYDFLSKLVCPFSSRIFKPLSEFNSSEKQSILKEISILNEWKVRTELDKLRSCIECREGACYIAYRWYDGQIHIAYRNVYKNLDWAEYLQYLLLDQMYFDDLPKYNITDFFVIFLDAEYDEPVMNFYNVVTCGFRVNTENKEVIVLDKETASRQFHTLCNRSLRETWSKMFLSREDIPDLLASKYNITKCAMIHGETESILLSEMMRAFVYPDGYMEFPDVDFTTEEGISTARNMIEEHKKNRSGNMKFTDIVLSSSTTKV